jgi:hypothetical protein
VSRTTPQTRRKKKGISGGSELKRRERVAVSNGEWNNLVLISTQKAFIV